jgi:hypothetical protein
VSLGREAQVVADAGAGHHDRGRVVRVAERGSAIETAGVVAGAVPVRGQLETQAQREGEVVTPVHFDAGDGFHGLGADASAGFADEFADGLDVGVLETIARTDRQLEVFDRSVHERLHRHFVFTDFFITRNIVFVEVDENTETFVVRQRVSARKPSLHPVVSRNLVRKEKCLLNRLKLKQFEFGVDPCLHQVMKVQVKPIQELSNKFDSCSQRLLTYTFE